MILDPYTTSTEMEMVCENPDCAFEGDVECWSNWHQYRAGWTCPDCNQEHDLDWDFDEDPDRYRD